MNRLAIVILAIGAAACHSGPSTPPRPDSVPIDAVWAGWTDGGTWIQCTYSFKEPYVGYDCNLYNDWTGSVEASGTFVLANLGPNGTVFPADPFSGGPINRYEWFDGSVIHISERKKLYPDGWIDYPFGDGKGKRVRYALGELVEEVSY